MPAGNQLKRVQRAVTDLVIDEPFYGSLALNLSLVEDPTTETFITDGRRIRFNPEFAAGLKPRELVTVIAHEVLHNAMGHLWRAPESCDWEEWNLSADNEVNHLLNQANQSTASTPPFPFPEGAVMEPEFAGKAAEFVYWERMGRKAKQGQAQNGKSQGQQQSGQGTQQQSGQGQGQSNQSSVNSKQSEGQGQGKPGSAGVPPATGQPQPQGQGGGGGNPQSAIRNPPSPASWGQFEPPPAQDTKQLQADWQRAVLMAARAARSVGRGNLPGQFAELVERIVNPKVDWRVLLRDFIRETSNSDYDWMRPNPHFADSGFMMPSLHSMRIGPLVFAKDTSGSISSQMLAEFLGEEQSALDEMNPVKLVDICADTAIRSQEEYTPGDTIASRCEGRGGTDFRPVFDAIKEWPDPPVALVYLTDLDGTFPDEEPDYPVLWLAYDCREDTEAPFGRTIHVED